MMNILKKNAGCIFLFIIVLIILYFCIHNQICEYYEQLDPILYKIKGQLRLLHPSVDKLKFLEGKKSYTINKKKVYLCLKDENGEYYDYNMLMYVALHELSHVICDEIGHTPKFHRIFEDIIRRAEEIKIYDSSIPLIKNYCGHN